ncbi:MAG: hypothetical protein M5U01_11955 [Ardenticatenaceae bacterium]|nr:hypothetical protein [Ardenticatenaceae bacterium]HBY97793.1 hypothetical protein [Chloroflexota bacterium]
MSRKSARKRPPRPAPEPNRTPHQQQVKPIRAAAPKSTRQQTLVLLRQIFVGPLTTRAMIATTLVVGVVFMLSPILTILARRGQALPLPILLLLLVLGTVGTILVYNAVRSAILRSRGLLPPPSSPRTRNRR